MGTGLSIRSFVTVVVTSTLLSACTAAQHKASVQDDSTDRLAVGRVQKEIHTGMSGAEVAETLGSPNIVSTDEEGREVWVYDKIATDTVYSKSSGGVSSLLLRFGSTVTGVGSGSYRHAAGASSESQRTLTVIIKYDAAGLVRDFAYHTSRF